ncbi:hypothetical protein Dvar_01270 [Desulfosarcina variabilis str. Montpellier]|uniref:hypothetical protein n=1 Tax=Desulfosarcina variabilis TaxID=2300 RepID=UPI003AFB34B5
MDDIARFEMFCKLRTEIRGSDNQLIVGIDIAKDKHHAFFGTPKGQSLWRRLIFTNDLTGFNRLIEGDRALLKIWPSSGGTRTHVRLPQPSSTFLSSMSRQQTGGDVR